jgi:hypothetical protein
MFLRSEAPAAISESIVWIGWDPYCRHPRPVTGMALLQLEHKFLLLRGPW